MLSITPAQQLFFIFLLSVRNRSDKDEFDLIIEEAALFLKSNNKEILNNLKALCDIEVITAGITPALRRHQAVITPSPDKIRLDKIREEKILSDSTDRTFDFEGLYLKYPRREGKTKGIDICKRTVKTQDHFNELSIAIQNYSNICEQKKTDPKYIKLFSTFMSTWRDWLDPEHGKVEVVDDYAVDIEKILARSKANGLRRL